MSETLVIGRFGFSNPPHEEVEKICSIRIEDGTAVEIGCEEENQAGGLDCIYVAKVLHVVPDIQAAFLEYEKGKQGYLSLRENKNFLYKSRMSEKPLVAGDEILVQIAKEPMKKKTATLSSSLSLSGRYAVLLTDSKKIMFSKKIASERKRLLKKELSKTDWDYGFVIRTNAAAATNGQLMAELEELSARMEAILKVAPHRTCFSCLYRPERRYLSMIKNSYSEKLREIVTDEPEIYEDIHQYLSREQPEELDKLRLYDSSRVPLRTVYGFTNIFDEALKKKVWLKSGGYLMIEQTEALLVIDVNSGKSTGKKKDVQETFLKTDMEAAREIARQLRLRNISGICIVDFVNLKRKEDTQRLLDYLETELKKDPVPVTLEGITSLYLVQITRKKTYRPLWEQVYGAVSVKKRGRDAAIASAWSNHTY